MATFLVLVGGGALFGFGIGVIIGYVTGKRHGLRASRQGFPVGPAPPTHRD